MEAPQNEARASGQVSVVSCTWVLFPMSAQVHESKRVVKAQINLTSTTSCHSEADILESTDSGVDLHTTMLTLFHSRLLVLDFWAGYTSSTWLAIWLLRTWSQVRCLVLPHTSGDIVLTQNDTPINMHSQCSSNL